MSEVYEDLRRQVRELVAREVEPVAGDLDRRDEDVPQALIERLAELGYLGLILPPDHGGGGLDALSMAIATEELSRGWLAVGSVMTRALISGTLLLAHGTAEQKHRWLSAVATGRCLTAAAVTEPDAGSDVAAVELRARRDGDDWLLDGTKTWCTHADQASLLIVLARTEPDKDQHDGLSLLLVEKPAGTFAPPALTGRRIPTVGYRGVGSFELAFDAMRVPSSHLLGGEPGKGFRQLMATFEFARIQTAARAVGVAQAALDAAIGYAKERIQFGVPIAEHQAIRHKIARMATEVEAARQLCYSAARAKAAGKRCDLEAGYAKAFAAEMAERVASEALQVFGGYGYSLDYPAQRYWRDARVFRIFEGTSEIQYEVIAKRLLD